MINDFIPAVKFAGDTAVPIAGKFFNNGFDQGNKRRIIYNMALGLMIISAAGQFHELAPPFRAFEEMTVFINELSLFFGSVKRPL